MEDLITYDPILQESIAAPLPESEEGAAEAEVVFDPRLRMMMFMADGAPEAEFADAEASDLEASDGEPGDAVIAYAFAPVQAADLDVMSGDEVDVMSGDEVDPEMGDGSAEPGEELIPIRYLLRGGSTGDRVDRKRGRQGGTDRQDEAKEADREARRQGHGRRRRRGREDQEAAENPLDGGDGIREGGRGKRKAADQPGRHDHGRRRDQKLAGADARRQAAPDGDAIEGDAMPDHDDDVHADPSFSLKEDDHGDYGHSDHSHDDGYGDDDYGDMDHHDDSQHHEDDDSAPDHGSDDDASLDDESADDDSVDHKSDDNGYGDDGSVDDGLNHAGADDDSEDQDSDDHGSGDDGSDDHGSGGPAAAVVSDAREHRAAPEAASADATRASSARLMTAEAVSVAWMGPAVSDGPAEEPLPEVSLLLEAIEADVPIAEMEALAAVLDGVDASATSDPVLLDAVLEEPMVPVLISSGPERLLATSGRDRLIGDPELHSIFQWNRLRDSLLGGSGPERRWDVIRGFDPAMDSLDAPASVLTESIEVEVGQAARLNAGYLQRRVLQGDPFAPHTAVAFGCEGFEGTFVAFNDGQTGYQPGRDSLLFLKGHHLAAGEITLI